VISALTYTHTHSSSQYQTNNNLSSTNYKPKRCNNTFGPSLLSHKHTNTSQQISCFFIPTQFITFKCPFMHIYKCFLFCWISWTPTLLCSYVMISCFSKFRIRTMCSSTQNLFVNDHTLFAAAVSFSRPSLLPI
jgi:hypothetical protein